MYFFITQSLALAKKTWSFGKNLLFVQAHYSHWLIHNKREGKRNHRAIKKERERKREKNGRVSGGKVCSFHILLGGLSLGLIRGEWVGRNGPPHDTTKHSVCVCGV